MCESRPPPPPQTPPALPAAEHRTETATAQARPRQNPLACGIVTAILLLGAIFVVAVSIPLILRVRKNGDLAQALANARSLGCALTNFKYDYGQYPDASTATTIHQLNDAISGENHQTFNFDGGSSNSYFRQLLAAGHTDTENIFYCATAGTRKPDNLIDMTHALEPGECGFSYLLLPPLDHAKLPLVTAPLVPGTTCFDRKPFGNKAMILWTDGGVSSSPLHKSGHPADDPLNPANPIWSNKPAQITWPE